MGHEILPGRVMNRWKVATFVLVAVWLYLAALDFIDPR
jgi:hypothetical protein